jgi:hypothetical protein
MFGSAMTMESDPGHLRSSLHRHTRQREVLPASGRPLRATVECSPGCGESPVNGSLADAATEPRTGVGVVVVLTHLDKFTRALGHRA